MTKEQIIFKNMKRKGNIRKCHGKWLISYSALYVAIKDAGYENEKIIWKIIDNMINKGYIRESRSINGKTVGHFSNYIIEKWVN